MNTSVVAPLSLCALTALLAACGGGGGDAGFPSLNDLPENGVAELQGQAVTAVAVLDPETDEAMFIDLSEIGESTVFLTTEDGEVVGVAITSEGSNPQIDLTGGAVVTVTPPYTAIASEDNLTFLMQVNGEPQDFEFQSIGIWADDRGPIRATVGAGAYGYRTGRSALPVGQRAIYKGAGAGWAADANQMVFLVQSDIAVSTDFRTVRIESTNSRFSSEINDVMEPTPAFDFAGTGPVTGSGFVAEVSGGSLSGQATGAFHGPRAEEVGGTYRLTGPDGMSLLGAFGAN